MQLSASVLMLTPARRTADPGQSLKSVNFNSLNLRRCMAYFIVTTALFLSPLAFSMPKLYFRHGAVASAKTLNLLAVAHNYRQQGKNVMVIKPGIDTRFGIDVVASRAGLQQKADVVVYPETNLLNITPTIENLHCVLVDEVQFLQPEQIEQLRVITLKWDVPVVPYEYSCYFDELSTSQICYGLRTDFRTELFPGSKRLLELADNIEEVKTTCNFCNRKAVFNLKHVNGVATNEGPSIQLGAEEKYFPACYECYRGQLIKAGKPTL